MKLSIIWETVYENEKNDVTLSCLKELLASYKDPVQIVVYKAQEHPSYETALSGEQATLTELMRDQIPEDSNVFEDAKERVDGDFVTYIKSGDRWSQHVGVEWMDVLQKNETASILMMQKKAPDGSVAAFSDDPLADKAKKLNLRRDSRCYPYYFGGTILSAAAFRQYPFQNEMGLEMERDVFLRLSLLKKSVVFMKNSQYIGGTAREGMGDSYAELTDKCWYLKSLETFWLPFLEELWQTNGCIPEFIQYHLLFTINNRIKENRGDKNRHVLSEQEADVCLDQIKRALAYVDDDVLLNHRHLQETKLDAATAWYYETLKHGDAFCFEKKYTESSVCYGYGDTAAAPLGALRPEILSMTYENGYVSIDGRLNPALYTMTNDIYMIYDDRRFDVSYSECDMPEKVFGRTIYSYRAFHVDIWMYCMRKARLTCEAKFGGDVEKLALTFSSCFSRFHGKSEIMSWSFGEYTMVYWDGGLSIFRKMPGYKKGIYKTKRKREIERSCATAAEVRRTCLKQKKQKNGQQIWLYLGYTGAHDGRLEQLYRTAVQSGDGRAHYYLIEESSERRKQLEQEGFQVVTVGSLQHKTLFFMADMILTAGSDLFGADADLQQISYYMGDWMHFKVCFISEQADAPWDVETRNRMQTHASLYFCASKQEMQTLSELQYGYRRLGILQSVQDAAAQYETITKYLEKLDEEANEYRDRISSIDELAKISLLPGVSVSFNTVTDYYLNSRICRNTVMLVGLGKSVRGSMQYVLNELNGNERFRSYRIYVRTSESTEDTVNGYIRKNGWTRTEAVTDDGRYNYILETAEFLLTEVYFPEAWMKKDGQTYVNIWHGTPLKKLGISKNTKCDHRDGTTQRNFIAADYLTYPNAYTKKHMLESYKVSEFMEGKAVNLGYPRTGGMLAAAQTDQTELRERLAPQGEHLYAYMPTWRDYLKVDQVIAESKELLDYLDAHLTDDQLLYVNLHHKVNGSLDYNAYKHIRKFPPDVDSYQLLALTDALITDYSSVFYDYLALRRQIILYCADYELYKEKRGTYMDIYELPFDKALTKEDVIEAINRGKIYDDAEAYERFCTYDSVDNARKLCSLLAGTEQEVETEEIPKSGRPKTLVYTECCEKAEQTDWLLAYIEQHDAKARNLVLSCDRAALAKKRAYPTFSKVSVIGTKAEYHPSGIGRVARALYNKKLITIEQAMGVWKYDYEAGIRRYYDTAFFDRMVIYSITDPEKLLHLIFVNSPYKILCVSQLMYKEISKGNTFLQDALRVAFAYVDEIYICAEEQRTKIQELAGADRTVRYLAGMEDVRQIIEGEKRREV